MSSTTRRHFIRGLIGTCITAAVAPSIFIPKIEPVIWKFPRLKRPGVSDELVSKYAKLVADYPAVQARLWSDLVMVCENQSDYFKHWENFAPLFPSDRSDIVRFNP